MQSVVKFDLTQLCLIIMFIKWLTDYLARNVCSIDAKAGLNSRDKKGRMYETCGSECIREKWISRYNASSELTFRE
jgi:hypothetical protein